MDLAHQRVKPNGYESLHAFVHALAGKVRQFELEHNLGAEVDDDLAILAEKFICAASELVEQIERHGQRAAILRGSFSDSPLPTSTPSLGTNNEQGAGSELEASINHHSSQTSSNDGMSSLGSDKLDADEQNISRFHSAVEVAIPYRTENGIVVLLPQTMDQCRDIPFLLAQAKMLGALRTGAFKYVLPDNGQLEFGHLHGHRESVSTFTSKRFEDGVSTISRNVTSDHMDTGTYRSTFTCVETFVNDIERAIEDPEKLSRMRYCTDQPARAPEDRLKLGFPTESAIWPLKHNQLDRTRHVVPGVHTPYEYSSNQHGAIFVIHNEDGYADSLNHLYYGQKLWLVVPPRHRHLIEKHVKRGTCAQKVRHATRYYTRSKLDLLGISYSCCIQRSGEVVYVLGDAYHQGGAIGSTRAEAVNYAPPGWTIHGYQECKLECSGFPIPNRLMQFRAEGEEQIDDDDDDETSSSEEARLNSRLVRQFRGASSSFHKKGPRGSLRSKRRISNPARPTEMRPGDSLERPSKKARPTLEELKQSERQIRHIDKGCQIRTVTNKNQPSAKVLKLVKAIQSRLAVKQFCSLIRSRRDPNAIRFDTDVAESVDTCIEQRAQHINLSQRRSILEKFQIRLSQFCLARDIEKSKDGRIRADTKVIDQILSRVGWKKARLNYHRQLGNKLMRVCGRHESLLCFIPLQTSDPSGVSQESYLQLQDADLSAFHRLLDNDYMTSICQAGDAFLKSLNSTAEDVEFTWEGKKVPLDKLPTQELLSLLKPFPSTSENVYDLTEHPHWPRPVDWPRESQWPADPTSLPDINERQCDFCSESACTCIKTIARARARPRIKDFGEKGRGLQALASEAGQRAYKKGEIIGQLTGKVVPLNMYNDGWSLELVRADIPEEPAVCQIHCAAMGSCFRLLNYSCHASTHFRGMRVSGRYRVMVKATRDIHDGEEITVNYGKDYLAGRKCLCGNHK